MERQEHQLKELHTVDKCVVMVRILKDGGIVRGMSCLVFNLLMRYFSVNIGDVLLLGRMVIQLNYFSKYNQDIC